MVLIFRWRASRAVEIVFHQNCGAFLAGALRARVEIVFTPCSRNVEIVNAWKLGDYEVRLRPSFCKVKITLYSLVKPQNFRLRRLFCKVKSHLYRSQTAKCSPAARIL